jgi:hypothetical protein
MRPVLAILVSFMTLLQSTSSLVIFLGYRINQDYIATNLCENRFVQKSHCHGSCHMMKEMKKEEQREERSGGKLQSGGESAYLPMVETAPVSTAGFVTALFTHHRTGTMVRQSDPPARPPAA